MLSSLIFSVLVIYFLKINLKGQTCKEVFWCSTRLQITVKNRNGTRTSFNFFVFCIIHVHRINENYCLHFDFAFRIRELGTSTVVLTSDILNVSLLSYRNPTVST